MNLALRVLLILICFELGVVLILVPWSPFWERNFFLERYPELIPFLMNHYLRGAVSGVGLLDVLMAFTMVRRRTSSLVEKD